MQCSDPRFDRLFKIRNLLDLLTPQFDSQYVPCQQLSVDEAMIPFKGRLGFKQYLKDKPTKWGIKVFVLSESVSGYVKRLQVYTGKESELSSGRLGLGANVVLELIKGLEQNHPHIYMDNFYTSPSLFLSLYNKEVLACGTCRLNRKHYPKDLDVKSGKVQSGFYDYRSCGPLLASVWKDKRIIHFLSTIHSVPEPPQPATVRRRTDTGTRIDVQCPPCLPDYLAYMRGVGETK